MVALMEEDYELVPLGPIRRLEKRLERIEKDVASEDVFKEMMSIVKANQQLVDSMSKSNAHIIDKVSELSKSVEKMMSKIDNFIQRIELSEGTESEENKKIQMLEEKIEKLEKNLNKLILSQMAKRKELIKRPMPTRPMLKRPLARPQMTKPSATHLP